MCSSGGLTADVRVLRLVPSEVAEPLTDEERQALEWLRDDGHERFRRTDPWMRHGLVKRGLVLVVFSRFGEQYGITTRGRAALDVPRRSRAGAAHGRSQRLAARAPGQR